MSLNPSRPAGTTGRRRMGRETGASLREQRGPAPGRRGGAGWATQDRGPCAWRLEAAPWTRRGLWARSRAQPRGEGGRRSSRLNPQGGAGVPSQDARAPPGPCGGGSTASATVRLTSPFPVGCHWSLRSALEAPASPPPAHLKVGNEEPPCVEAPPRPRVSGKGPVPF